MGAINQSAGIVADVLRAVQHEPLPHIHRVTGGLTFGERKQARWVTAVRRAGIERDPNTYRALRWYGRGIRGYVRLWRT